MGISHWTLESEIGFAECGGKKAAFSMGMDLRV